MPFIFINPPKIKDWSQAYEALSKVPTIIILKSLSRIITAYGIIGLGFSLIKERKGSIEMDETYNFKFNVTHSVIVKAKSEEEAYKMLNLENYKVLKTEKIFQGICDEEGNEYPYELVHGYKACYFKSACPLGYDDCIHDPARKQVKSLRNSIPEDKEFNIFLKEDVELCSYNEGDECDMYDDEDK